MEKTVKMNGAEILLNCLVEQGVDTVFGYPGGTILNIYDELYKFGGKIKHYLTAHEQGAAHAADGYARATGKVGVCFATSGPGATNLVTGIATAHMDSVPVVAITCNVAKNLLGRDTFQEVDITGITMPITKHNFIVTDAAELADTVREAFYIARSGRCGPVLIDITKDATAQITDYAPQKPLEYRPTCECGGDALEKAAALLNGAKKPFVVSGGGVIASGAEKELKEFVDKLNCPVSSTMMGLGSYPTTDEKFTGMIGMHGTKASNIGINSADVVVAIGMRFSDRVTSNTAKFVKNAKIIHIDIDAAEICKNVQIAQELVGDAKEVLKALNAKIRPAGDGAFLKEISAYKAEFPHKDSESAPLNPEYILKKIYEFTDDKAVLTTEVGQNQLWTAQFGKYLRPRSLITSGGLGTMGFGTGAAMGAKVGLGDRYSVIAIAGDGSFRMNCNELCTLQYYHIPVIIVIMDNHVLGNVRQWQTMFYGKRYSETTLTERGPDFVKLADAYGIDGYRAANKAEFDAALKSALEKNAPAVIDAEIDIDDFVLPMVAPGKAINEIMSEKPKL
ncbi:MAG: biosynthetic-type acetolactate synthase large subunit [Bacillota bacterium]|nr:MAG: biosynthetic-type acetolactate synthase large subunit [Bacillota bacterium]